MSKKTPSQDLSFENPRPEEEIADDIKWDFEGMKKRNGQSICLSTVL